MADLPTARYAITAFTAALVATACSKSPTQLFVLVDSDIEVPSRLTSVNITVQGSSDRMTVQSFEVAGDACPGPTCRLPLSLGVVPGPEGATETVTLTAEARGPGGVIVSRRVRTGFLDGQSLLVPIFLAATCEGVTCGAGQTCARRGCVAEAVDPEELPVVPPGATPTFPVVGVGQVLGDAGVRTPDAAGTDAGAHLDATQVDTGAHPDATTPDAGDHPDATQVDTGLHPDATTPDAGVHPDATQVDTGLHPDAQPTDSGVHPDAQPTDSGVHPDAQPADSGVPPDAGSLPDAGAFASGTPRWTRSMAASGRDRARAVVTDSVGNLYVAGRFTDSVDFGNGAVRSQGSDDIFLASYDAAGGLRWVHGLGGTSIDFSYALDIDAADNLYFVGYTNRLPTTLDGAGTVVNTGNVFLSSFRPDGTNRWVNSYGTTGDALVDVAVTPAGEIFVLGHFQGSKSFGGANMMSAGLSDIFIARYSSAGTFVWSQRFGGANNDYGQDIEVDGANIFVTGHYESSSVNFGGANLIGGRSGQGEIFVASFTDAGVHRWSHKYGSTRNDRGKTLATDSAGNVYLAAEFFSTVDFGDGPISSGNVTRHNTAVASYNVDGVLRWSRVFSSGQPNAPNDMTVDANDRVCITGFFEGTTSFVATTLPLAMNVSDVYVTCLSSSGAELWAEQYGSPNLEERGLGITAGPGRILHVVGSFTGTTDLGGMTLTGGGDDDAFVLSLHP